MLKYNGSILRLPSKATINYEGPTGYTRFMWRFDGIVSSSVFQMGAIKLNNINLPYTYVTFGKSGGSDISSQMPEKMVAAITGDDPYHKWCIGSMYGTKWGWFIFDMPTPIVPTKYELQIGGDTAQNTGRNPTRTRLYASYSTPTTFDDQSWELVVDSSMTLPTTNYGWVTVWEA